MPANPLNGLPPAQLQTLAHQFGVQLIVLFGSVARDASREGSDVDIAVLLEKPPGAQQRQELWAALSRLFPRDVDLTVLNHAEPLLKFLVAYEGKVLFAADDRAWGSWKSYAARQYWDTEKFREALKAYLARRAEEFRHAAAG